MANKTLNLDLNIWFENDPVNFEEMNYNFEKLDSMTMCIESGKKTAYYSGGIDSVSSWYYKKYSDGTIEMSTKLDFIDLKCNGGTSAPYYSGEAKVSFPFAFSEIYDVQIHMASSTIGWVCDTTPKSVLDYLTFKVMGQTYESNYVNKQVYLTVKGVIK